MDIHDLDDLRYPYDLGNHHMCHGQKRDCQKQFKASLVFFTDDYKPKKIMFWVDPQLETQTDPTIIFVCCYNFVFEFLVCFFFSVAS